MSHRTALAALLLVVLLPGLFFAIALARYDPVSSLGLVTILASLGSLIFQSKPLRAGVCPFCDSPYPAGERENCPDCGHSATEARRERRYGYLAAVILIVIGIGVIFLRLFWGIAAVVAAIVALIIRMQFDIRQNKNRIVSKADLPPQNPEESN